jgi:hypothetical protein
MTASQVVGNRARNLEHLRNRLAERGMTPRENTISLTAAREWLTVMRWAWPDINDALDLIAGRPGRLIEGRGWRLIATQWLDTFELVAIDRYAGIALEKTG